MNYSSDKPINDSSEDLLGRAEFSKQLAQSLLKIELSDPFAVGIYGKWGSGKTSVLNMMQREIESQSAGKENAPVIMRFEPWNFSDCNQLLTQFFAQLSSLISLSSYEPLKIIGEKVKQYASGLELLELIPSMSIIAKIARFTGIGVGKALIRVGNNGLDVSERKQEIIDALKSQDGRIIVIIDDIDRLSNDQIRLIFQLVAAVAGFPNIVYVLSFDREIVSRALGAVQNCDGNEYLEKIVQVQFELPIVKSSKIYNVLFDKLNSILSEYPQIKIDSTYWNTVFSECVAPFINSLRDVARIVNSLSLKIALVENEVDFCDLVAITTIQITSPSFYEWIKANSSVLVGSNDLQEQINRAFQKDKKDKSQYLKELSELSSTDADSMLEALTVLFPKFASEINRYSNIRSDDELRKQNRIGCLEKYEICMSLSLEEIAVPNAILQKSFFNYDIEELTQLLMSLNRNGNIMDYLIELKGYIPDLPENRIALLVQVLVELANSFDGEKRNALTSIPASSYAEYLIKQLLKRIPSETDRDSLMIDLLDSCTLNGFQIFANLLNSMELAYGRLAAAGKEHGEKLISIIALEELEKRFADKVLKLFNSNGENLLAQKNAAMLDYLWRCFDKRTHDCEIMRLIEEPENICRFIALSASRWRGSEGSSWEFNQDYSEYVSDEEALQSIQTVLDRGTLFSFDLSLQKTLAAFYLWKTSGDKYKNEHVDEQSVNECLLSWITDYVPSTE